MKSKTLITVLVILSVVEYTLAVINSTQWAVLPGIQAVALAVTMMILAFVIYRQQLDHGFLRLTAKTIADLIQTMKKGIPATLTLKGGKATVVIHDDDPEDEGDEETPQEQAAERAALNAEIDQLKEEREQLEKTIAEKAAQTAELQDIIHRQDERNVETTKRLQETENHLRAIMPVGEVGTWVPQPELIKSVYASVGVMKQMNEHTDADNLMKLWEQLKTIHKVSTQE